LKIKKKLKEKLKKLFESEEVVSIFISCSLIYGNLKE
jgi:hypothetical protein